MNCAIIILNWNAARDTLDCIDSIIKSTLISPTIYVVDNNSNKTDKATLSDHNNSFQLIQNEVNRGFAGGNNIGIKAALDDGHEAILLLNNDARISDNDILILLQTFLSNRSVGVAGPVLYEKKTNELLNAGGKDIGWNYTSHLRKISDEENIYDVDYVSGTAIMIRSEVFNKIGLLDERYFFSGEIADLCKRIHKYSATDGYSYRVVICPKARAIHSSHGKSNDKEALYTYYIVRNRYLYIRKFLWAYLPVLFPFWIYKHSQHAILSYKTGRVDIARTIARGIIDGLSRKTGPKQKYQ